MVGPFPALFPFAQRTHPWSPAPQPRGTLFPAFECHGHLEGLVTLLKDQPSWSPKSFFFLSCPHTTPAALVQTLPYVAPQEWEGEVHRLLAEPSESAASSQSPLRGEQGRGKMMLDGVSLCFCVSC